MLTEFLDMYCTTFNAIKEIQTSLQQGLGKAQVDPKELADLLYALKKTKDLLDSQKKNLGKTIRFLETAVCQNYAHQLSEEGAVVNRSIKTEWCTATPNVEQALPIPKPGEEKYDDLMEWLGVPEAVAKSHVFRLDWDALVSAITQARKAGCPMPKKFSMHDQVPRMSVRILGKKDLLESCSNTSITENGTEKT